uniref:Uncharacterized protein n=1 Tax=Ananas comosus var. bracteatus TaxID=296719 RepID=A0A6V7P926_ANACO|nr:unnamed protein product [Ananas comosus var. bracteatus]
MPITRSQSAGADNAANFEEVETSATSGSSEVRELRGQLAALTDLVTQQAEAARQQTEAARRQEARMKRSLPTSRHSGDSHRDSYSPCEIGRRSGLPWARLIPRVGMMTTTGPLGSAPARQPTGGSQGHRQPSSGSLQI